MGLSHFESAVTGRDLQRRRIVGYLGRQGGLPAPWGGRQDVTLARLQAAPQQVIQGLERGRYGRPVGRYEPFQKFRRVGRERCAPRRAGVLLQSQRRGLKVPQHVRQWPPVFRAELPARQRPQQGQPRREVRRPGQQSRLFGIGQEGQPQQPRYQVRQRRPGRCVRGVRLPVKPVQRRRGGCMSRHHRRPRQSMKGGRCGPRYRRPGEDGRVDAFLGLSRLQGQRQQGIGQGRFQQQGGRGVGARVPGLRPLFVVRCRFAGLFFALASHPHPRGPGRTLATVEPQRAPSPEQIAALERAGVVNRRPMPEPRRRVLRGLEPGAGVVAEGPQQGRRGILGDTRRRAVAGQGETVSVPRPQRSLSAAVHQGINAGGQGRPELPEVGGHLVRGGMGRPLGLSRVPFEGCPGCHCDVCEYGRLSR